MSKHPEKDFGPIADDYAFFESHATEAERDARAHLRVLRETVPAEATVRMLDFGCGSGNFTARLLRLTGWPRERLRLSLVEPVASARRQALERLSGFTNATIAESAALPAGQIGCFDVVLANHVFYYVPDLRESVRRLVDALCPKGVFVTSIAGRSNALIDFWTVGFGLLGREIPYNTSEDVETALHMLDVNYAKQAVPYELTFPDTEENRMRIIRFLLADHLASMPLRPLLDLFDRHSQAGQIHIQTSSDHFTVRR